VINTTIKNNQIIWNYHSNKS